ncbi:hypothetical protein K1719_010941 [Acacia pycnantha]|nr:hypothetical protein K1719_010941 [Acacia pycnantha]
MAMKRSLWSVLCVSIIMLVVSSSHVSNVHCRVLRSETVSTEEAHGDCNEMRGSEKPLGMASFALSSNNSSTHNSIRSLTFLLASGPSKKGPGH